MKKFSRMPKSEGSGGGGAAGGVAAGAGCGSGGSSVGVRVFSVGRYQVTLEESLAEGTGAREGSGRQVREGWGVAVASRVLTLSTHSSSLFCLFCWAKRAPRE